MNQSVGTVFMVRPAAFGFNSQTAASNAFQSTADLEESADSSTVKKRVAAEFDALVGLLRQHGVEVTVFEDSTPPIRPDAIFPNNWISLHESGWMVLYPMLAANRRLEIRRDWLPKLASHFRTPPQLLDLTDWASRGHYLEGTGSLVLDHPHQLAYAALSPRTDPLVLEAFCGAMHFQPVHFTATDAKGQAIYHTNVVMTVGSGYTLVCLEAVRDSKERAHLQKTIQESGQELLPISLAQVVAFAGNMLELQGKKGVKLLLMSSRAKAVLSEAQQTTLAKYAKLIDVAIPTIENVGGGGVRCMVTEIRGNKHGK